MNEELHDHGTPIQRDVNTMAIAGAETALIGVGVLVDAALAYKRHRDGLVKVMANSPKTNVQQDLEQCRTLLREGNSPEAVRETLKQESSLYRDFTRHGKGEQYLNDIMKSAERKNAAGLDGRQQQQTKTPKKSL